MKSFITALLLTGLLSPAFSQTDSLNVIKANWKKKKITSGVTLKTNWFNNNLFGSNQNVSVLEIKPKRKLMLDLGFDAKKLITTSDFGQNTNSIAALNGTFFDIANGGSVDFIKSDGIVINESRLPKNGLRVGHQASALVFKNGKLTISKFNGDPSWEQSLDGEDVMVTGPLLILDQKDEKLDSNAFSKTRHPRTAVAVTKNNRVLLITVDGRNENSAGMSLFELTKLMRWLNSDDAINLDGGGSTTLWLKGYEGNGVVNYPTDNKKWDHEGERKVANVVLLKKK
ncbi:phosphodiester glycosidase family protein [Daejeonella lutea]|uniref:Exopolysaccharide biosynthesis protein n=1 Tax=Daejeonella lutea TaxID=572036 RepID=A0A1T5DM81_9SPHI|nr:phosphodiester glycosidase family protein [Daejeonella lutea]SKB72680.1 Exopolysaccharide biosynthesis protein [Daejeonella lutea]